MNDVFLSSTLGQNITDREIAQLFAGANNSNTWQRVVFQLARELDPFPDLYKNANYLIKECESSVWLIYQEIDGRVYFLADSDSRLVRGLLAIFLTPLNGISVEEYSDFSQNVYLSELHLYENMEVSDQSNLKAIEDEVSAIFHGLKLN